MVLYDKCRALYGMVLCGIVWYCMTWHGMVGAFVIWMDGWMDGCMFVYVCVCARMCACVYVCTCLCVYVCMCVIVYVM